MKYLQCHCFAVLAVLAVALPVDPDFFPIAVWLQDPANAGKYKAAGVNTYVALWEGPTEEKMARLKEAGMKVILEQSEESLRFKDDKTVIAWMHGDEPDNAQKLPDDSGYGPPVPPATVIADYEKMRKIDPTRPVLLNLGQGVAWDNWIGRGVRSNHPEDYREYVKGGDIVSFDIYPAVHEHPEVAGKLWMVADGVSRLRNWAGPDRTVWNCIECTRIGNVSRKPTPTEVRAEVWMSLIRGSQGIIYFAHQFKPEFREAALLDDPEMLKAVTELNRQIHSLARVLKGPSIESAAWVLDDAVPVETMCKQEGTAYYFFSVCMRNREATATIGVPEIKGGRKVEVLFEDRQLKLENGRFTDQFAPWGVHIYRVER